MPVNIRGWVEPEDARTLYDRGDVSQIVMVIREKGHSRTVSTFYYYGIYIVVNNNGTEEWYEVRPHSAKSRKVWRGMWNENKEGWYMTAWGLDRTMAILSAIFGDSIYNFQNRPRKAEIVYLF